MGGELFLIVR